MADWNAVAMPVIDPVAGHAAAAALGAVLLIGALAKLREPAQFRDAVDNHRLLPAPLVGPVARTLPWLEAAAGGLLLPVGTRAGGALLALVVLAVVSAAVAINLARGRDRIDCGCGGALHMPLSRALLWRNAALAGLALLACAPLGVRATGWLDALAAGFAVLFALGLYVVTNVLIRLHSHLTILRNSP